MSQRDHQIRSSHSETLDRTANAESNSTDAVVSRGEASGDQIVEAQDLDSQSPAGAEFSLMTLETSGPTSDLIDALPVLIAFVDSDERYRLVNSAYASWLNLPREAIVGQPVRSVLTADAHAALSPFIARALAGERLTFRCDLRLADGESRFVESTYIPERAEDGTLRGFCAIVTDRTGEHRKEKALIESEQRFKDFANVSSDWLWEMGSDLRFSYLSDGITRMTGEFPSEFIGKSRGEIAGSVPVDASALAQNQKSMERHEPFEDFLFRRPNLRGGWVTLSLSGKPIFADDGSFQGYRGSARNITEKVETEEALRVSEGELARAQRQAAIGHWRWSIPENRLLSCSDEYARIHGVSQSEIFSLMTRQMEMVVHPSDRERVEQAFEEADCGGKDYSLDYRIVRPDGAVRYVHEIGEVVTDETGTAVAHTGTVQDVTERRVAEEALRESEARLRAIFEHSPVEIYLKDTKGRHRLASARSEQLYGGSGSVVGKTARDLFAPGEAEQFEVIDREVLETNTVVEREVQLCRQGEQRTYLVAKFPILDTEGNCEGIGAVSTDITERKLAEEALRQGRDQLERRVAERTQELQKTNEAVQREIEDHVETEKALRESRALLEAVLNAAPMRIDVRDVRSRFLFMNGHQGEVLDVEPEDAVGKTPVEQLGPEVGEYEMIQDQKAIELGRPLPQYEEEIPAEDGSIRTWLTSKVPIVGAEQEVRYLVTTSLDVTDLKSREQELKQAQRMDAIGKLTGGIAHDFNNLLFVIGGNLQLLEEDLTRHPEARDKLLAIKKSAKIGTDLTRSLLAFSRQTPLSPISVNISETIGGTVRVLLRTLSDDIFVETSFAEDAWPVLVDPSQLENAILNLAVNARDAMSGGGQLKVQLKNVTLSANRIRQIAATAAPGDYVMVSVSDSGHGMTSDVIERAFEPFFTTKETSAGTGLGLSMVYGFVHQSGGHVDIESAPGRGTTVKMYLPRAPVDADFTVALEEDEAEPFDKGVTILVTEDDDDVRQVAIKMLERMGYSTLAAKTGKEAISIIEQDAGIDLLFTDVVMPGGLNGRELAERVKQIRPALPVLFASGYARSIIVEGGKIEEGVQILSKPYGPDELGRAIRFVLEGRELP